MDNRAVADGAPPKLSIEMVPEPCWRQNLRNALTKDRWVTLSREVTDLVGVRALDEPTSLRRHWLKLIHENDPPYQVSVAGASLEPDHELLFDLAAKRLPDPSAVIYLELAAQHLRDDLPLPAGEYRVSVEATGRLPTGDPARSKTERFRLWVQDAGELAVERIS